MTSTFYIPKDKEKVFHDFVKRCNEEHKSYSSLIVELMTLFNSVDIDFSKPHYKLTLKSDEDN